ncbi:MAG: hypothetical protein V3T68_01065 [Dehalococcoidales bacterium]
MVLRTIINWGWAPVLITAVAIIGNLYEWPIEVVAPVLGVILIIGLITATLSGREKEAERLSVKLRQLAAYFDRRFLAESSLSIFAIIGSLFKTENPKLWDWARSCDMAQRVLNTWSQSFLNRLETDTRTGRFRIYLRTYLSELWLINSLYYEFVEQFQEIAEKVEIPPETLQQYHRFVLEYNAFAENFRNCISELLKAGKTEIEPPSVKSAKEVVPVVTKAK